MRRTPRSHTETRGNRMCVSGFRPVGLARAIRNYNRCPESHGPSKPLPMAVDGRGKVAGQGTVKSAAAELRMSALCQKATSAATRESEIELTCERELQWECQLLGGRFHETSTQTISTSRRGCRRAAGYFAKRIRARLPD